jgi:hypothetical protein
MENKSHVPNHQPEYSWISSISMGSCFFRKQINPCIASSPSKRSLLSNWYTIIQSSVHPFFTIFMGLTHHDPPLLYLSDGAPLTKPFNPITSQVSSRVCFHWVFTPNCIRWSSSSRTLWPSPPVVWWNRHGKNWRNHHGWWINMYVYNCVYSTV